MNKKYSLVFYGIVAPGQERELARSSMAEMLKIPQHNLDKLFSGKRIVLKSGVDEQQAERYKAKIEAACGVRCAIEPEEPAAVERAVSLDKAPEAGLRLAPMEKRTQQTAESQSAVPPGESSGDRPDEVGYAATQDPDLIMLSPHRVPARQGLAWILSGFHLFNQNKLNWVVAMLLWGAIVILLSLIPVLGIFSSLLYPVFMAGFMLGADAQMQGRDFTVAHVFAGFSQQTGKLIGLGALYIGFMLLAALLMVAMVFGMGDFSALTEMSQQGVVPTEADVWAAFGTGLWVAILLSSLVFMLLAMAFWLAPALVVFHDIGLMEALALSLKGLLVNWLALLVYGVFTMLLSIIAIIPLGLGLLILGPVMLASVYASYLDIFNLDNAR